MCLKAASYCHCEVYRNHPQRPSILIQGPYVSILLVRSIAIVWYLLLGSCSNFPATAMSSGRGRTASQSWGSGSTNRSSSEERKLIGDIDPEFLQYEDEAPVPEKVVKVGYLLNDCSRTQCLSGAYRSASGP